MNYEMVMAMIYSLFAAAFHDDDDDDFEQMEAPRVPRS